MELISVLISLVVLEDAFCILGDLSLSLSLVWFICACSLSGCCFITPHCRCLNVDDKRLCVYIEYPPTFASLFFFPSSIFLALIPPLSSSCRMSAGLEIFSLLLQCP